MIKILSDKHVNDIVLLSSSQNFLDGWNSSQLDSWFKNSCTLALGYEKEDNLVGYITLTLAFPTADLEDLLVSKEFRGQGVATLLIKAAENSLKDKGYEKIFLEVRENNFPALKLYEKSGFKIISVRKKYYADGENALVLVKEI